MIEIIQRFYDLLPVLHENRGEILDKIKKNNPNLHDEIEEHGFSYVIRPLESRIVRGAGEEPVLGPSEKYMVENLSNLKELLKVAYDCLKEKTMSHKKSLEAIIILITSLFGLGYIMLLPRITTQAIATTANILVTGILMVVLILSLLIIFKK